MPVPPPVACGEPPDWPSIPNPLDWPKGIVDAGVVVPISPVPGSEPPKVGKLLDVPIAEAAGAPNGDAAWAPNMPVAWGWLEAPPNMDG